MATKKQEKKMNPKTAVAIGVGTIALAAATYYFFGPNGKKNRTKLRGWMIRMKGEIVEKMEQAKDMTESLYHKIVDAVAARYGKSGISPEEIKAYAEELKRQWKGFAAAGVMKKGAARRSQASKKRAPAKKKSA